MVADVVVVKPVGPVDVLDPPTQFSGAIDATSRTKIRLHEVAGCPHVSLIATV